MRYHISPRTGNPVVCKAKLRCPFGDLETEHYNSRQEAAEAYERRNQEKLFPSFDPGKMVVEPLPASMRVDSSTLLLPRGMYVLGDPSLILGEDPKAWGDWIETISQEEGSFQRDAVGALVNNYPVVGLSVKAGPGFYQDSFKRHFEVPSEQFAALPLPLVKKMGLEVQDLLKNAVVVSFDKATLLHASPEGELSFGETLTVHGGAHYKPYRDPLLEEDEVTEAVPATPYYEQP